LRGGFHHVDLTVKDPKASRAFYDAVLGFMGYRRVKDFDIGFEYELALPNQTLSIAILTARGPNAARPHDRYAPGLHHVAWAAHSREDVDSMHELLRGIGATILDAPAHYPQYSPGYYAVFFADPDGLKLEYVFTP
jgi:catechol 2,3-dioxygenase-like lactoylglutathione lyase family enzyme